MKELQYNRSEVVEYASKWAYSRNPAYYNYDLIGGDCTNFVSQCLYAGAHVMNYSKPDGWFYVNGNNKSPSWTGVQFLYNFLIKNKSVGPYGLNVNQGQVELGDIAQLSFDGINYGHTLVIVKIQNKFSFNTIYTASHTFDSYARPISTYTFQNIRFVHIVGVRNY